MCLVRREQELLSRCAQFYDKNNVKQRSEARIIFALFEEIDRGTMKKLLQ